MSRLTKSAEKPSIALKFAEQAEVNYMGGISYKLNPLDALRIMATSCIFGEPQYYRDGDSSPATISNINHLQDSLFGELYALLLRERNKGLTTANVMEKTIDDALSYDFAATMRFADELRNKYWMRLNPSVICVRAAMHPKRKEFTSTYPGLFKDIVSVVAKRPDDLTSMIEYYIYANGSKNGIPRILKDSIAKRIKEYDRYQMAKHANKGIGLVDVVRITHAHNDLIDELMKNGKVTADEDKVSWRTYRSDGRTWEYIFNKTFMTHQDILFNLRGIFSEDIDLELAKKILDSLVNSSINSMAFPYRYWTAYNILENSSINHRQLVLDALEFCLDKALELHPKLNGKVMCLSDNSGSAWGAFTFEGSKTLIGKIDNLSSLMTAMTADEGYVGLFGDKLEVCSVSKRNGVLNQLKDLNAIERVHRKLGGSTENGIWLFWDKAIRNKEHWDTVFIYSDMQAGHGGLYGINPDEYKNYTINHRYVDVLKLVDEYRKKVNKKVNVISVQTGGYKNSVIPEHLYRGAILSGWTGKEAIFAKALIDEWDRIENKQQ